MGFIGRRGLFGDYETTRLGRIIGPDETERLARTFHVKFASIKVGGKGKSGARGALNYARRKSEFGPVKPEKIEDLARQIATAREAKDEEKAARLRRRSGKLIERGRKAFELESEAGDPKAVLFAAGRIEKTARITRGDKTERALVTEVFELPGDSTREQRLACIERIVREWGGKGHPAHAVVHGNDRVQPHAHVLVAARPVDEDGKVNRGVRLLVGREAVRERRAEIAKAINETCRGAVLFHEGRHEAVGIDGDARRAAGLFQRKRAGRAHRVPDEYGPEPDSERAKAGARLALARTQRLVDAAETARREASEKIAKSLKDAEARVAAGEARVAGIEDGTAELQDAGRLTGFQTEAMTGAAKRAGKTADLETAAGQALGFALLNLERARRREKEIRARKEALEEAEREAALEAAAPEIAAAEERGAASRTREIEDLKAELQKARDEAEGLRVTLAGAVPPPDPEIEEDPAEKIAAVTTPPADPKIEELTPPAEKIATRAEPDPQPKPAKPSRPAWQLPPGELMAAGHELLEEALAKWGGGDNSPSSMPLEGLADNPVLTFEPEAGVFRKRPATWRYEDEGRYADDKAIRIPQTEFRALDTTWPDWDGGSEALLRVLVTDALEDGAERPGWLQNTFPDLDEKYGPKIRTKNWYGDNARTYEGEMSGGEPHGHGAMTWGSGERYEGQWKDGRRHGARRRDLGQGWRPRGRVARGAEDNARHRHLRERRHLRGAVPRRQASRPGRLHVGRRHEKGRRTLRGRLRRERPNRAGPLRLARRQNLRR